MSENNRRPAWHDDVPFCTDECPQHDGKRCRETGFRPGNICEPEVRDIVVRLRAREGQ